MKRAWLATATGGCTLFLFAAAALASTDPPKPNFGCSSAESKQFDFWIGDWDLTFDGGGKAKNRISKILDECVVLEEYTGGGLVGKSFSTFDPQAKQWRHTWIDNTARHVDFAGEFQQGRMVVTRDASGPRGAFKQRLIWSDIQRDSLKWTIERSDDSGKSWKVVFSASYQREKKQ